MRGLKWLLPANRRKLYLEDKAMFQRELACLALGIDKLSIRCSGQLWPWLGFSEAAKTFPRNQLPVDMPCEGFLLATRPIRCGYIRRFLGRNETIKAETGSSQLPSRWTTRRFDWVSIRQRMSILDMATSKMSMSLTWYLKATDR